ncbi:hypothetical protein E1A91_A01G231500v1 [Gossypium mustelinum]|uniref:Uncharacterized protein n=1 Tax=Gossypium mustelinum TaxID=34275 RepID=A0A5D3AK27_GOSMU|nr:hypothetical protein E1A91_A01G231500v1 [Gossypium mustelinum]
MFPWLLDYCIKSVSISNVERPCSDTFKLSRLGIGTQSALGLRQFDREILLNKMFYFVSFIFVFYIQGVSLFVLAYVCIFIFEEKNPQEISMGGYTVLNICIFI